MCEEIIARRGTWLVDEGLAQDGEIIGHRSVIFCDLLNRILTFREYRDSRYHPPCGAAVIETPSDLDRTPPVSVVDPVGDWHRIARADAEGLLHIADEYRRLGISVDPDFVDLVPRNQRTVLFHLRKIHLDSLARAERAKVAARRAGEDS